jgi:predicted alpha/beta-fold hydrolase
MNADPGPYRAPPWLPGGDLQTIVPVLLARPVNRFQRTREETPDGDFVDFDWLESDASTGAPLVALFHGLESSGAAHYASSIMAAVRGQGWRGVVPHFRGCSGVPNRLPRAYHSGDHAEVGWMLRRIRALAGDAPVYAVGVSLGGSALLNWLGRAGASATREVDAAAAVSTPLDLTAAGIAIEQGFNRIYSRAFQRTLKPKALAMALRYPGMLDAAVIRRVSTMYAFDDAVTAPLHGFAGTDDYWSRASSKPWLRHVGVPTLVLNAKNDPFIPAASLPAASEVSAMVTLEQPDDGGHAGFPSPPFPACLQWLPKRLVSFLRRRESLT